ncbi:MAG: hypothetical protein R2879_20765 [Saprospiraceae bacterium]
MMLMVEELLENRLAFPNEIVALGCKNDISSLELEIVSSFRPFLLLNPAPTFNLALLDAISLDIPILAERFIPF